MIRCKGVLDGTLWAVVVTTTTNTKTEITRRKQNNQTTRTTINRFRVTPKSRGKWSARKKQQQKRKHRQ